jgi:hypothetical protein
VPDNENKPPLGPISEAKYREFFALIQNPLPGSAIESAMEFGIDLYTTLENLRLTPGERVLQGMRFSEFASEFREAARKARL